MLIEAGGTYRIRLLTTDKALIKVDGREVFNTEKPEEESVSMKKGFHSIQVEYKKTEGDLISVHLVWMIPGQNQWEVVPPTAFGPIRGR